MMNSELLKKIDSEIEKSRKELVKNIIKLVNIKSVEGAPEKGAPFGRGPKKVLDTVLEMGEKEGFFTADYNTGVVSVSLKKGQPDLGIWGHGDVVPEGDNWIYEPYNAVEYKECVIGRGATDNKGQIAAVFQLLKIFKALNIDLGYNVALYVGSDEESGKKDIEGLPGNSDAKGFLNVATPPRLSLVPDSGFPVGYGGKGAVRICLKSKKPLKEFTLSAGQNEAPGVATAVFERTDLPENIPMCNVEKNNEKTYISYRTLPGHGAHPTKGGNMISALCEALIESVEFDKNDSSILEFLKSVSLNTDGGFFGISTESELMKPLTVNCRKIDTVESFPILTIDVRYPIEITAEEIVEKVNSVSSEKGFEVSDVIYGAKPYLLEKDTELVRALCDIANEIKGKDAPPYTVGGGTYAHVLPNAYVYGMNGNLAPKDFPEGRGGAHGVDEAVSLDRLTDAMKIYARALLSLNDIEW